MVTSAVLKVSMVNQQRQGKKSKRHRTQEENKCKHKLMFGAAQLRQDNDLDEFSKMKEMLSESKFGEAEYLQWLAC